MNSPKATGLAVREGTKFLSLEKRGEVFHVEPTKGQVTARQVILAMGFPVFCRGIHPADSLGRLDVQAHQVPIVCGGVAVEPDDLVLADHDGVVVVPYAVAEAALTAAEEKVRGENLVRQKLAEGMSAGEAFRRYGVL